MDEMFENLWVLFWEVDNAVCFLEVTVAGYVEEIRSSTHQTLMEMEALFLRTNTGSNERVPKKTGAAVNGVVPVYW